MINGAVVLQCVKYVKTEELNFMDVKFSIPVYIYEPGHIS